jgi:hypothetical protein
VDVSCRRLMGGGARSEGTGTREMTLGILQIALQFAAISPQVPVELISRTPCQQRS